MNEKLESRNMKSWLIPNEVAPASKDDQISPVSKQGRKSKMKHPTTPLESDTRSIGSSSLPDVADQSDRDRLWGYLFGNINRSVDELYQLCEEEKSTDRCHEAIGMLSRCQLDFQNLILQIREQARFLEDQAGGVSWEVRKPVHHGSPEMIDSTPTTEHPPIPHQTPGTVSKLNATAPPFLPKGFHPPVATTPPKRPEKPSLDPLQVEVQTPVSVAEEISTGQLPESLSNSFKDEVSDHEDSESEHNDPSSDEREALEVAMESELVWAQTEAWVEAEIIAEEEAWNHLLLPLSSDFDTDLDETDSKDAGFENCSTPHEERRATKTSVSLVMCETSDDQDLNPPDVKLYIVPQSPLSPTLPLPLKSPLTSSHRRLHDKLSSPDRSGIRNQLTTEQIKLRQEIKQSIAESNRDKTVREIKQKAMVASNRVKASEVKEAQRIALAEQLYRQKLEEAEKRHSEYIKSIRGRAGNENTKVSEVLFINSLNEDALAAELQRTLEDVENRILAGRKRREEHLTGISDQQRRRNRKKVEQMSELRLALEKEKMDRWEKIQTRLETVRIRREERLAELQRRTLEARERASISSEPPLTPVEPEKEYLERKTPKKDSRKDKKKKLSSFDDSSNLETNKQGISRSSAPLKNPLQIDDDTIDSILQGLKTSNSLLQHPGNISFEGQGSSPFIAVVNQISSLLDREITPSLSIDDCRLADLLGTTPMGKKRKQKVESLLIQAPVNEQLERVDSKADSSMKVDITDALCSLSPSIQHTQFLRLCQFLDYCLNKEFGCLSNLPLLMNLTRTSLSPQSRTKHPQSFLEKFLNWISLFLQSADHLDTRDQYSMRGSINSLLQTRFGHTLADLSHFSLAIIQKWGEKAFPLVLQHHQKQIAKPLESHPQNKIFWPPFILSVIPNLFLILFCILDVPSPNVDPTLFGQLKSWAHYICWSGVIDQISMLFRELQCVADFSEKDDFLASLLCNLSQFIQRYVGLIRALNCSGLSEEVTEKFRKCDISWNLISLLGVLLLQDGAQSHSYRRQSHQPETEKTFIPPVHSLPSKPRPTQKCKPSRRQSSGSSSDAVPEISNSRVINHATFAVCLEILCTLNGLSQLDVSIVQQLPPQMQALTLHVTDRLLTCSLTKSPPIAHTRLTRKSSNSTPFSVPESTFPSDQLQETVLTQTLTFVGFLCVLCPENQNFLSSGTPPNLLIRLCNLPVHYFTDEKLKEVVFPTLVSLCFENDSNLNLLRTEMNPIMLSTFLQALLDSETASEELDRRLPRSMRERGVEYFRE